MGLIDDLLIFSNNEEEHLEHLEKVFEKLSEEIKGWSPKQINLKKSKNGNYRSL